MNKNEKIQFLIDSVIDNTSLEYWSGENCGMRDRMKCSICGADTMNMDVKLSELDHASDCSYIIALTLEGEIEWKKY